jgi:hypothetical protein
MVISTEAAHVDNAIVHDSLTSQVALEEPEIGSTDPNILIDNNCLHDELHFGLPGGCEDYNNSGDEIVKSDAFSTASRRQQTATELERFGLGTGEVDGYNVNNGNNADAD